jgi:hypothetical protein
VRVEEEERPVRDGHEEAMEQKVGTWRLVLGEDPARFVDICNMR